MHGKNGKIAHCVAQHICLRTDLPLDSESLVFVSLGTVPGHGMCSINVCWIKQKISY